LLGITVNLLLGSVIMVITVGLLAVAFWQTSHSAKYKELIRVLVVLSGLGGLVLTGRQVIRQYHAGIIKDQPIEGSSQNVITKEDLEKALKRALGGNTESPLPISPILPTKPDERGNPLRAVINYIRTDWGHTYNPRTLFMAHYRLDTVPALSPIDMLMNIRLVNTQETPLTIEAWSIVTGPTPDGPWQNFVIVPGSPHLDVRVVGSLVHAPSYSVNLNDFGDSLKEAVQPDHEVSGWILCECPGGPPCLSWYQRLLLKDTHGMDRSIVLSLSDYNLSAGLNKIKGVELSPVRECPPRDVTDIELIRPFPTDAYRADIIKGCDGPSVFRPGFKQP
jgi:hypothetical protein